MKKSLTFVRAFAADTVGGISVAFGVMFVVALLIVALCLDTLRAYNMKSQLQAALDGIEVWKGGCSHYYLAESGRMVTQYPWSMWDFKASAETPNLDDFELA